MHIETWDKALTFMYRGCILEYSLEWHRIFSTGEINSQFLLPTHVVDMEEITQFAKQKVDENLDSQTSF